MTDTLKALGDAGIKFETVDDEAWHRWRGVAPDPVAADVERPISCPKPGQVSAFDAGWLAHETGIERKTVEVLCSTEHQRGWALMGWDVREKMSRG